MRTLLRVMLVGWLTATLAGPAEARIVTPRSEMQNPGLPVQQPDHVLAFPKSPANNTGLLYQNQNVVYDLTLTPDGSRLVYTQDTEVLDAWFVVVWAWPETVLTLLGLVVLWRLAKAVRRRRRFPAGRGPYCAGCAYVTHGVESDACPECGNALGGKGTTAGVSRFQSFIIATVLLLLAFGIGAVYQLTNPPRFGDVNHFFSWRSEGLATWAREQDIRWMEKLIQPATAVRDVPVTNANDVHTIAVVPKVKDPTDRIALFYGRAALSIGGLPRPYADDRLHTNPGQTLAVVNNDAYAYRIDLATFEYAETPHLIDRPRPQSWRYRTLAPAGDASYRLEHNRPSEDNPDPPPYTLTHSIHGELACTVEPEIVLPVQARAGGPDFFAQTRYQLADGTPYHTVPVPEPYHPGAIHIDTITAEDGQVFYRCRVGQRNLSAYVAHGYVVVLSYKMIYLYDLGTARWAAALDTTPVHDLWSMDGTATAVSADRRWFAVRGRGGEQVAVYRLPDPAGGP